jgi:hypothetical protein
MRSRKDRKGGKINRWENGNEKCFWGGGCRWWGPAYWNGFTFEPCLYACLPHLTWVFDVLFWVLQLRGGAFVWTRKFQT